MTQPKFIITLDGLFRLGMVNQHKDLLKPGDSCLGGGYYHFDYIPTALSLTAHPTISENRSGICWKS